MSSLWKSVWWNTLGPCYHLHPYLVCLSGHLQSYFVGIHKHLRWCRTRLIYYKKLSRHGASFKFLKCENWRIVIACFMKLNLPAAKKASVSRQTRRMCCFENVMLRLINQPVQHQFIRSMIPKSSNPKTKSCVRKLNSPHSQKTIKSPSNWYIKRMKS